MTPQTFLIFFYLVPTAISLATLVPTILSWRRSSATKSSGSALARCHPLFPGLSHAHRDIRGRDIALMLAMACAPFLNLSIAIFAVTFPTASKIGSAIGFD